MCNNFPDDFESHSTDCSFRLSNLCRRAEAEESFAILRQYSCNRCTAHKDFEYFDLLRESAPDSDSTFDSVGWFSSSTELSSIRSHQQFRHRSMTAKTTIESSCNSCSGRSSEACTEYHGWMMSSVPALSCCNCWWQHCMRCSDWPSPARWAGCCCCHGAVKCWSA